MAVTLNAIVVPEDHYCGTEPDHLCEINFGPIRRRRANFGSSQQTARGIQAQNPHRSRYTVHSQLEPDRLLHLQTQLQRLILGYDDSTTPFSEQRHGSSSRREYATAPFSYQRHGVNKRDDAPTLFGDLCHDDGRSVDAKTPFGNMRHSGSKCDDTTTHFNDPRQRSSRHDDAATHLCVMCHGNGRSNDATRTVSNNSRIIESVASDVVFFENSGISAQDVIINNPFLNKQSSGALNPCKFNLSTKGARFFILKSSSEDEIRHSIADSAWNGTSEDGNSRLNLAIYERQGRGPVILFFNISGSGCFCGVAQMTSAVDYRDDVSCRHQGSKKRGKFKVRWIYAKNVPNDRFCHIRLNGAESKTITCCLDTEEVPPNKGKQILNIVHAFRHTSSVLHEPQVHNGLGEPVCVARNGSREGINTPIDARDKLAVLDKEIQRFCEKSNDLDNLYRKREMEKHILLIADLYGSLLEGVAESDTPTDNRVTLSNDLRQYHGQLTALNNQYTEEQRKLKLAPLFSDYVEGIYSRVAGSQASKVKAAINKVIDINGQLDRMYRKESQNSPTRPIDSDVESQSKFLMEQQIRKLSKQNHHLRHRLKEMSQGRGIQDQTDDYLWMSYPKPGLHHHENGMVKYR